MQTPSDAAAVNTPVQAFAPLPLRALGVLEIVDTAIKLLRRYFLVLIAWSAIVMLGSNGLTLLTIATASLSENSNPIETASTVIAMSSFGMMIAFFLWPFVTGAVTCCIAAAVRGQTVTFKQCWNFTKPRYGKILGAYFLSILTAIAVIFVLLFAIGMVVFAGAFAMQGSGQLSTIIAIVGVVLLYASLAVIGLALASWMMLAPIVACLENDPMTSPLRRAWDLLKGNWRRAMNLALLFGLIQLVILIVLGTLSFSAMGAASRGGAEGFLMSWAEAVGGTLYTVLNTLVSIITTPFMLLLVAVLYLDLRTRKEALDLEWTAHVTSDGVQQNAPRDVAPQSAAPVFTPQPVTPFNSVNIPPPPPDAPQIPDATRAAWLGAPPDVTAPDTQTVSVQTHNTQILPNNAAPLDASTQVTANTSADMGTQATTPPVTTPTTSNSWDTPINVWDDTSSTSSPVMQAAPEPAVAPAAPAFNLETPPPAPQPSFIQFLPDDNNTSTQANGARTCTQCSSVAQEGQSFCMQCGARLPVANSA